MCNSVSKFFKSIIFGDVRRKKKTIGISWNSQNLRLLPALFLFLFLWLLKGTSKIILIFFPFF